MSLPVRELYYDDTPDAVAIEQHIKFAKAYMTVVKMTWPHTDRDGVILGYHSVYVTPNDTASSVQLKIYSITNHANDVVRIIDQGGTR